MAILFQGLAAALSGLTAGLDKVAVLSRPLRTDLSPGRAARGFSPGGELSAERCSAAGLSDSLRGFFGHGLKE